MSAKNKFLWAKDMLNGKNEWNYFVGELFLGFKRLPSFIQLEIVDFQKMEEKTEAISPDGRTKTLKTGALTI